MDDSVRLRPFAGAIGRIGARLACMLGLSPLILACDTLGQTSVITILTNGPASNRFNIAFLSEGYTAAQLPQFRTDATNALNALLSREPYRQYSNFFNAWAISVASVESGSDHPAYAQYRNTYFNSSYDAVSDWLITIPPNSFDSNASHGQGRVDALLQTYVPNCHLPVLLVNDIVAGGSDGFDQTAVVSMAAGYDERLTHETGHVVAGLGDEYAFAYPGFPDTEEPNTTRETNRASIKWRTWIAPNTPLPTPQTGEYAAVLGLFEGAHYHSTGWYRPMLDCAMRSQFVPFCDVCREALVLSIYRQARPIDAISPAGLSLSVSSPQALAFSVTPQRIATSQLSVQWYRDGQTVPGQTNVGFLLFPATLTNGAHTLSVMVKDQTPWVRNDPTNRLAQSVSWDLTVTLPQLRLDSPLLASGGGFAFRISGTAPSGFVVQSSADLLNWIAVSTNTLVAGESWYTNAPPLASGARHFRATGL